MLLEIGIFSKNTLHQAIHDARNGVRVGEQRESIEEEKMPRKA